MTTPAASNTPNPADVPVPLDEKLRSFWARYGNAIYVLVGLIALGIVAKGGLDYLAAQKELEIEKAFSACTTPESFKAFAADHRNHPLGALVELKIADEAFLTAKFAEAVTGYEKAVADLQPGPFQARAKLGLAVSKLRAGHVEDGEAALRQLLSDETQYKLVRCEAGYDLAEQAVASNRPADVQKIAEQLMQIDPTSPFAERTFALRTDTGAAVSVPAKH